MKVMVKFTDDVSGEWIRDILEVQNEHGFINVKHHNNLGFIITEPKVLGYRISSDWIERIIKE